MSTVLMSPEPATAELKLDHLRALEAESIHIMREVVAEFERPVMLYSIGKDSSVLLRLAQKAFYPGPIPFPLLHVDTTYKFREMIEFRDQMAAAVGARLIVHTNEEAIGEGTQPFKVGTQRCCGLLKTKALLDGLQAGNFDAAIGGARRDEEKSRAKERVFSIRNDKGQWDPKRQRPELWNLLNGKIRPGESIRVFPLSNWTEIDVWQYIQRREHSDRPALLRQGTRGHRPRQLADRPGAAVRGDDAGREAAEGEVPHALARLLALHRRHPLRGRHGAEDHRRADRHAAVGAAAAHHRPRPGRVDGSEEARRIFLRFWDSRFDGYSDVLGCGRSRFTCRTESRNEPMNRELTNREQMMNRQVIFRMAIAQLKTGGLLRICTAGSVDDGKSTLIGRLLYDSRSVYEDQVQSIEKASKNRDAGPIDFSLFTDGLKAEREQGITIDVAYRYFATSRRKFILADTPGPRAVHAQHGHRRVDGGRGHSAGRMRARAC